MNDDLKTERIIVLLTPALKERLRRVAASDGRSDSNYVGRLIESAVEAAEAAEQAS